MPSFNVLTDQELFFIGTTRMQLMDLAAGTVLGEAVRTDQWMVTVERDSSLAQTFATRVEAAQYLIQNGTDPAGGGKSTFHPNLDEYTD